MHGIILLCNVSAYVKPSRKACSIVDKVGWYFAGNRCQRLGGFESFYLANDKNQPVVVLTTCSGGIFLVFFFHPPPPCWTGSRIVVRRSWKNILARCERKMVRFWLYGSGSGLLLVRSALRLGLRPCVPLNHLVISAFGSDNRSFKYMPFLASLLLSILTRI